MSFAANSVSVICIAAFAPLGIAEAAKAPVLTVREVSKEWSGLSASAAVDAKVQCPSGWKATGIGIGQGAMDLYYWDTDGTGRGYAILANAPDSDIEGGWSMAASVTCVRGAGTLSVRSAAADAMARKDQAKVQHDLANR